MHAENDTRTPYEQRQWFCRLDEDPAAVITARAHGDAPVTLTVTVRKEPEPIVILEIADASPELPVQDLPGEVGHFGLWIAEELACVTIHPTTTGKTVRAELVLFDKPAAR